MAEPTYNIGDRVVWTGTGQFGTVKQVWGEHQADVLWDGAKVHERVKTAGLIRVSREETPEMRMFGCTKADIAEQVEAARAPHRGGLPMFVMSLLSDVQELIQIGRGSVENREQARQTLNVAKYVVREHLIDQKAIQDALGTAETGTDLVEVARGAHAAEQELAAKKTKEEQES